MKTKLFLYSLLAFTFLLTSCDFGKERRLRNIADRPPISGVSNTPQSRTIAVVDSLAKIKPIIALETRKAISTPTFSNTDWRNAQTAFQNWRTHQISNGNFMDSCPDIDFWDTLSETESRQFLNNEKPRYALPNIDSDWGIDVLKVDLNFDGRKDVIFRIHPQDCLQGTGTAIHPPLYVTAVSDEMGRYTHNNLLIDNVKRTLKTFRNKLSDWEQWLWVTIDDITTERGVIEISGRSHIFLYTDATCCPSIRYDFLARVDKFGRGYIVVSGVYEYERNRTHYFELTLPIE